MNVSNFVFKYVSLLLQNLKVPVPEEISLDLGKIILHTVEGELFEKLY